MQLTTIFTGITAIAAMAATAYGAGPVNVQPAVPNNVTADKFSKSAVEKIEAAGGSTTATK